MKHLKNINGIGLYVINGKTVKGPQLLDNMPECTNQELYDYGLITISELKIFNRDQKALLKSQYKQYP